MCLAKKGVQGGRVGWCAASLTMPSRVQTVGGERECGLMTCAGRQEVTSGWVGGGIVYAAVLC